MNAAARPALVRDAMIRHPKTLSTGATVHELRSMFASDKVCLALILDGERLLTAVDRQEVPAELADDLPARGLGTLAGRVVRDDAPLDDARALLDAGGSRRLAVVDQRSCLVGLLCLKRTRSGYCSDRGIESRARERVGFFGSIRVPPADRWVVPNQVPGPPYLLELDWAGPDPPGA